MTNGVKPRCILAPTLYGMFFAMLSDACQQCLQVVIKVKQTIVKDFLLADDCSPNAASEQKMPASTNRLSTAYGNFRLTLSTIKLKCCIIPFLETPTRNPTSQ